MTLCVPGDTFWTAHQAITDSGNIPYPTGLNGNVEQWQTPQVRNNCTDTSMRGQADGDRVTRCLPASPEAITEQYTVVKVQCRVVELIEGMGLRPKAASSHPGLVDHKPYKGADTSLTGQIVELAPALPATDALASPDPKRLAPTRAKRTGEFRAPNRQAGSQANH